MTKFPLNMKKTLFLTALLGLCSQALAVNGAPLKPQTIMTISEDATLESSASDSVQFSALTEINEATVRDYIRQARQNVGTFVDGGQQKAFRPVVVKDGQGTLIFSGETVNAVTPFAVREGTVKIYNELNLNWGNGSAISVSGTNAQLIVDGGTVNLTGSTGGTSVAVGGIDGDGMLIMKNQAAMKMAQSLFSGTCSFFPYDSPGAAPFHGVETHLGGTYVSLPGTTDDEYQAPLYRDYAKDSAFSDKREDADGTRHAHGRIDVLDGSSLNVGQSLYAGNTSVTISGSVTEGDTVKASTLTTGLETPQYTFDSIGWGEGTETTLNIRNGGVFTSNSVRLDIGAGDYSEVCVNVIDGGSLIQNQHAYADGNRYDSKVGYGYASKSVINVENDSHLSYSNNLQFSYNGACESVLNIKHGSDVTVGGTLLTNYWGGDSSEILVDDHSSLKAHQLRLNGSAYVTNTHVASDNVSILKINEHSAVNATYAGINPDPTAKAIVELTNHSTASFTTMDMGANSTLTIDETSTLMVRAGYLMDGATLINHGLLDNDEYGFIALYGGSRLQSGEVLVSGCDELVGEGNMMEADYRTGVGNKMLLYYAAELPEEEDSGVITLGALLTGKDKMQYLSSGDIQTINKKVFDGLLMLENTNYTIAYKHEIGQNITLNYTTDHLNNVNGTENIAVKGGAILVEQGEGEHHVGTIGSYADSATETAAAIAVHEQTSGSKVTWEGAELQTVAGERALIAEGNQVTVAPSTQEDGKLTVVGNSALRVQGSITADGIIVESGASMTNNGVLYAGVTVEGTLNGSGTINGSVTLSSGGTLIVGNSPGYQIVSSAQLEGNSTTVFCIAGTTASSAGHTGWASGTASQLCITEGALTLSADACITIEFGGSDMVKDAWNGQMQGFVVTLVQGGCEELTAGQLSNLLANTTFKLTEDAEGLLGLSMPSLMGVTVYNARYEVVGADLVLRGDMKLTPEPATATLSLLALAGLAMRRRRQ